MKKIIKKILTTGLVAVSCLTLIAGCGSSGESTVASGDNSSSAAAETTSTAPGAGATKLGVILVGTRDDYGYNQGLYD